MTAYATSADRPLLPGGVEIWCSDVGVVYDLDGEQVTALSGINATIAAGERVALFGPSGSGKSTLTSLLAGLRRPSTGEIWLGEQRLTSMSERQLLRLRRQRVGVVLQNPTRTLLPYASAEDNILFAQCANDHIRRRRLPSPD